MLIYILKFLIDPFNLLWLILLTTAAAWVFKKDRLVKRLVIVSCVWFLLISTPTFPNLILHSLESKYNPVDIKQINGPGKKFHIIILGGGHGFDDRLPPNSLLSLKALSRLNEGIRLHRQLPNSMLILSGFSSAEGRTTQAEMLQKTAILLGVEKENTILQKEPGNTYEEAKNYATKFGTTHRLILVTSAAHMPRAIESFKRFGTDPIPSPTNYRLKGPLKWFGLPSLGNIENLKTGIYEYAGIIWYSF